VELAALLGAGIKLSIVLLVLAIGLEADWAQVTCLFRRPAVLLRAALAMFILVPAVAVAIAFALPRLEPAVKAALILVAISPVPPFLPNRQIRQGGSADFTYGLLATSALVAIVLVPLLLDAIALLFDRSVAAPASVVARVVVTTVLAPLGCGLVLHELKRDWAVTIAPRISAAGTIILLLCLVPALAVLWPEMTALIGNGTLLACVLLASAAIAIGHALGGPVREDRITLGLASASRHPGMAIALAAINFGPQRSIVAAVLLYVIVSTLVSIPYGTWLRHTGLSHAGNRPQPS
jgi:BASS family bile acid:Na+ symporter